MRFINAILETGVRRVQVTSFVSPRWVPQLADALEVLSRVNADPKIEYSVLIPNRRGLEQALEARTKGLKCDEAGFVMSASESHSKANLNRTIREVMEELPSLIDTARPAHLRTSVTVSVAFGCSIEVSVPFQRVAYIFHKLKGMGVDENIVS